MNNYNFSKYFNNSNNSKSRIVSKSRYSNNNKTNTTNTTTYEHSNGFANIKNIENIANIANIDKISGDDAVSIITNPNFMTDILIRFSIIACGVYVLYKYYIIDFTIELVISRFFEHIDLYINKQETITNKNVIFNIIIEFIDSKLLNLEALNLTSSKSTVNDNNMIIILAIMMSVLTMIVVVIMLFTRNYTNISYKLIFYELLFNVIIIVISQVLFYYFIYYNIDPIKIYTLLYYDYNIVPVIPKLSQIPQVIGINTPISIQNAKNLQQILLQSLDTNKILQQPQILKPNIIDNSFLSNQKSIVIFSFTIILAFLFIIFVIISFINYSNIYNNSMFFQNTIIPLNQISLYIYILLSIICLIGFIILLLLLLSKL